MPANPNAKSAVHRIGSVIALAPDVRLAANHPQATFGYEAARAGVVARVERIARTGARHSVALPAVALHYVLAHPTVTAVVVGARPALEGRQSVEHLNAGSPNEPFDELAAVGPVAHVVRPGRR